MATGSTINYAGEYKLHSCRLDSSTGVSARLDSNVTEINIYESLFTNTLEATLIVVDQNNMIMNMPIVGQEYINLKIETPSVGVIENIFCVYKVISRQDLSTGSQTYELQLISPETLRNNRTRISKSYTGLTSDIITKILRDEKLINTNKDIYVDKTSRIRKFVAPNVRPQDFINNLIKESTSETYGGSPHYFFYETTKGFNFRVLDSLYQEPFKGRFVASEAASIDGENKRNNIEKDFQRIIDFSIGTTNDTKNKSSNFIVKNLKNIKNFNSISDQLITSSFFKKNLQKSITENFSEYEIENFKSDLVISNATIEHVGNYDNQKTMFDNMIKLCKKMIIISTPYRYHPLEFHTKIPLIHWLPKNIHRKILKNIGLTFFSKEENLNLLSKSDFNNFVESKKIKGEFRYIKFLFFKSNLIFIGKKYN